MSPEDKAIQIKKKIINELRVSRMFVLPFFFKKQLEDLALKLSLLSVEQTLSVVRRGEGAYEDVKYWMEVKNQLK